MTEFFDQNPISQLAILVTRDGQAERLSSLSGQSSRLARRIPLERVADRLTRAGNPVDHLRALDNKKKLEPKGEPSLQNTLDMARSGLS